MAQERDSSGRFKPKNSGGGEGRQTTLYQDKKKIPPPTPKVDSLDDLQPPKQGLTEDEAVTLLDDVIGDLDEASLEGYLPDEGEYEGDPEALRRAAEQLRADGSIDSATEALEELDKLGELDADSEDGEPGETGEGEPIPWEALAEKLGVDADRVMVRAKVQGEEMEIPLSEAVQGYQREKDYRLKTTEVAEKRKQLEGALEGSAARLQALDAIFGQAMTPEQRQQVGAAYQRVLAERAALQAHHLETEVLPQEHAALAEKLGWEDEGDVQEGKERLAEAAISFGFDPSDLSDVRDHRLLVLLDRAARYEELQEAGEDAKASARANRRKGRTLKPGTSGAQKPRKPSKLSEARRRLSRTGREEDAVAALDHILPDDII